MKILSLDNDVDLNEEIHQFIAQNIPEYYHQYDIAEWLGPVTEEEYQ